MKTDTVFKRAFNDALDFVWNKRDERQRNEVALRVHLSYIDALQSRDAASVERACRTHLTSARATLIRSTSGQAKSG